MIEDGEIVAWTDIRTPGRPYPIKAILTPVVKRRKIWFDLLTYRDAKLLKAWWSRHPTSNYYIARSPSNRRFWALFKE